MNTLLNGVEVTVSKNDGSQEVVTVRQFKVKEYDSAFSKIDDEIGLVALAIDKPLDFVGEVSPESYEELQSKVREINEKGFFVYSSRKQERIMNRIKSASKEMIAAAAEKTSKPSAPGLQPRAA